MTFKEVDPDAHRKFRLSIVNGVILTATWKATPAGLTIATPINTDTTSTAMISGFQPGTSYTITCHITCTDGQEDDRSIVVKGKQQ